MCVCASVCLCSRCKGIYVYMYTCYQGPVLVQGSVTRRSCNIGRAERDEASTGLIRDTHLLVAVIPLPQAGCNSIFVQEIVGHIGKLLYLFVQCKAIVCSHLA